MKEELNGRVQPQATDLEEVVIGACLLEKEAINKVISFLTPNCFYKEQNKIIFESIIELFNNNNPVDLLTVVSLLKKKSKLDYCGGAYYVAQLTNRVASTSNVEYHARIIAQKHMQRELITISNETISKAYDDANDVFDVIDCYEQSITKITSGFISNSAKDSEKIYLEMIERNTRIKKSGGKSGVATDFWSLDEMTGGWQESDLIILAARPGMGKTALSLAFLSRPAISRSIPTAIFSLEMSAQQLYARLQACESDISIENILRKGLDDYELSLLNDRCLPLRNAPIYIDDTASLTVFELRNKARKLYREKGIKLIIVDYLQLMRSGDKAHINRDAEIGYISRSLKALAKELNIPVIALSQLSREVEKTASKVPQLSHLRESGSIEQDADMVMFIYRPEYYGITEDENGNSTQGKAVILIEKHRNGATGNVTLNFEGRITKFSN
jgi:replicative DNA helicase